MNTDLLLHIINQAKEQNKAVELYINFIHERITIEPEHEAIYADNNVIQINENIYISTDYISMAKIIMNKKEHEKQIKQLLDELRS